MGMIMEINHRPETVLNHYDFEDLIDKYMGSEAADYYRDSMKELLSCIHECNKAAAVYGDIETAKLTEEILNEYE